MSLDDSNGNETDGAGDLQDALGTAETEFVTGEKPAGKPNPAVMLALVAAVAAGGYFLFLRKGPASAEAAVAGGAATETQKATETITQFLGGGNQNIALMEQMLRNTEKVVEQFLAYPSTTQIPLKDLRTNPFRDFQADGKKKKPSADEAEVLAKKKREEERQAALKAVQSLQLQSIIAGTRKACMINNTLVSEGQQVDVFTVEKIDAGGVIVRTGAYRFELRMQQPK